MKFYVVIDTNVIVSAFNTSNKESSTVKILHEFYKTDKLVPLYSDEIIEEYKEVLNRSELKINNAVVGRFINTIRENGILINPDSLEVNMPDKEDIKFYELVMDKRIVNDKFLITGNIKHFPKEPIIVTPSEFMLIYANKF